MKKLKLLKALLIPALGIGSISMIATIATSCGSTPVDSVSLNKSFISLTLVETKTLTATVLPETATDKSVNWTSSNPSVATVDSNGTITAVSEGTATITVKTNDGGKTATCKVTVNDVVIHVESVELNKHSTSLVVGNTETLTATVLPEIATDKSVNWTSSNPSIATVDSNGTITAVSEGTATITVETYDGGKTDACVVNVNYIHVTSVELNKSDTTLTVGDTETLTATVLPETATDKSVTWTSSDTNVATVDSNGTITAVATGTATIIVTSVDNPSTDCTCNVRVVNPFDDFVCITANEDSTLSLQNNGGNNPDLQYSTDGTNWSPYRKELGIPQGYNIYLRGNNPNGWSHEPYDTVGKYSSLLIRGDASIAGNVMGLLDNGAKPGEEGDITGIPCSSCFYNLFENSIGITSVSEDFLPVTSLADHCYASMFHSCTSLTNAPKLPAGTLINECYRAMFAFCSSLSTAPDLPATTLADNCYTYMFQECTSLSTTPDLPATILADYCYSDMFSGCSSLTTAPYLPAITLSTGCYYAMFRYCSQLRIVPNLPATTLAVHCYHNMFINCTSLRTAPALPATILADSCYLGMFNYCTSLTTASPLPATTLASECYYGMFYCCTSLTSAPYLPATTLADSCYNLMFQNCSSLNSIKIAYTGNYDYAYFNDWVKGVVSSGVFYYNGSQTPQDFQFHSGWTKSPF